MRSRDWRALTVAVASALLLAGPAVPPHGSPPATGSTPVAPLAAGPASAPAPAGLAPAKLAAGPGGEGGPDGVAGCAYPGQVAPVPDVAVGLAGEQCGGPTYGDGPDDLLPVAPSRAGRRTPTPVVAGRRPLVAPSSMRGALAARAPPAA
ncbi:hypothetical protein AB0H28_01020 [Micromonospora sp. NPDC050980]|uniref:hypothetical protein n=1 Tax=Micromonospora sp. NPDC050980 TaxID=3155161 RepID=UPI0033F56E31